MRGNVASTLECWSERGFMKLNKMRIALRLGLVAAAFLVVWGMAMAQNDQVKGVINGRSGATMSVLTQSGESITVVLSTDTQVLEPEGLFRKKHLTMTALVPGLAVEAKGAFNDKHQLVAAQVVFHGGDLKTAKTYKRGWLRRNRRFRRIKHSLRLTSRSCSSSNRNCKRKRQRPLPIKRRLRRRINASENWVTTILWARSRCCLATGRLKSIRSTNHSF